MPAISMKKVLVLSSHPKVCQAATAALARDYSVYASPCRRPDVGKFVVNFGPDVIICDRALLKSVSAAARSKNGARKETTMSQLGQKALCSSFVSVL